MRPKHLWITALLTTVCSAAPLTITLTGTAVASITSGSYMTSNSSTLFTYSLTTDTNNLMVSGATITTPTVPVTVGIGGVTGTFQDYATLNMATGTLMLGGIEGANTSLMTYNLGYSIQNITLATPGIYADPGPGNSTFGSFSIALVSSATLSVTVGSAPVTITFQGTASGNFLGSNSSTAQPFTGSPFTFTLITDTSLISNPGGTSYQTPYVLGTVTIDQMSGTFSSGVGVQVSGSNVSFLSSLGNVPFTVFAATSGPLPLTSPVSSLALVSPMANTSPQYIQASFGSFSVTSVSAASITIALGTPASLPHLAFGGDWTTGVYVINTSSHTALYSINFRTDDGSAVSLPFTTGASSSLSGALPPQASAYVEASNPQAPVLGAWGQIDADPAIVVSAIFRRNPSFGSLFYEAGVPSVQGGTGFEIPFDATTFQPANEPLYTGIAIANLDPINTATVDCIASAGNGHLIGPLTTSSISIAPLGHWGGFNFPSLTGQSGTLVCTSNTGIVALALRFLGTNAFSTLPVILQ